jgi:hypothetical protein
VKQFRLGKEGLDFLLSFLKGGSYLGRAASELAGKGGEVVTWLPDGVGISSVSLKEGWGQGAAPVREDLWRPLADLTREYLSQSPDHVAIVEASCTYPIERLPELLEACNRFVDFAYFTCNAIVDSHAIGGPRTDLRVDVFGYLQGGSLSIEHVSEFIDQAFPHHQIIALTSTMSAPMVRSGSRVEGDYVTRLAGASRYVAAGAYDGMGVVLWTRPDSKKGPDHLPVLRNVPLSRSSKT